MGKSNRQNKRAIVEIDFNALSLKEMNEVTQALAALEDLGARGIVKFSIGAINASKKRGRASPELPPLQPQAKIVLDCLNSNTGRKLTAEEIAKAAGIKENSVRGQLHGLLRRKLVIREQRPAARMNGEPGSKFLNVWCVAAIE